MPGIRSYSVTPSANTTLFPIGVAPSLVGVGLRQMQADLAVFAQSVIVSVKEYGAVGDGSTDDSAAFNAASAAITAAGRGRLIVPAGSYMLANQWVSPYATNGNVEISAYGAVIYTTGAIAALNINSGASPHGLTVNGLGINATDNATQTYGIDLKFCTNIVINDCYVEGRSTRAGYAGIRLGATVISNDDTQSFWTIIRGFRTRSLAGGGTLMENAIMLFGAANATVIRDGNFGGVANAIKIITNGGTTTVVNGLLIDGNAFENITTGIYVGTGSTLDGLRITNNRAESITSAFLDLTNANTSVNQAIWKMGNYFVSSVVADVLNPNNIPICNLDFPVTPNFNTDRTIYGINPLKITGAGTTGTLKLQHNGGKALIVQGGTANDLAYWGQRAGSGSTLTASAGNVIYGLGMNVSSTAVEVRNPNGAATFAAATSVAATFGVAEADAAFKVMLTAEGSAGAVWVTAKTTAGFTINAPAAFTGTINWLLVR
jgi:hypothetical protein